MASESVREPEGLVRKWKRRLQSSGSLTLLHIGIAGSFKTTSDQAVPKSTESESVGGRVWVLSFKSPLIVQQATEFKKQQLEQGFSSQCILILWGSCSSADFSTVGLGLGTRMLKK